MFLNPETNETARAATLTVSANPNSHERILPMNMVQTANKVNGIGSDGNTSLPDALHAHLSDLHSFAVKAQALADALNALADDAEFKETSIEIATTLSSITSAIAHGLDSAQIDQVMA